MFSSVVKSILSINILCLLINLSNSANILAVFPVPSISHQIVYRPLMIELAKRGHQVVEITPDPVFTKNKTATNLTEIDIHEISYKFWKKFASFINGNTDKSQRTQIFYSLIFSTFKEQFESDQVQKLINDKHKKFDLLFVEHFPGLTLSFSYLYDNIPVISFNSFGPVYETFDSVDAVTHPLIYPAAPTPRFYKLTTWERLLHLYGYYTYYKKSYYSYEAETNRRLKTLFGAQIPELSVLRKNIHLTFLNTHPIWDNNRPVPPNIIYVGGIQKKPVENLPEDLKLYLDKSTEGFIYMSFGSNIIPSLLSADKVKIFMDVFAKLPLNVLLKWDKAIPRCPSNVIIKNWYPQSDILNHKNIKIFISHGGYQSMSETVDAGTPVIGIPLSGDQWFNAELFLKHEIGLKLDLQTITEESLKSAIFTIMRNESYRNNINRLRTLLHDQPQSPLERAVWWTEYVLRHGGATQLRSAAAHMHWTEYYEIKIITILTCIILLLILFLCYSINLIVRSLRSRKTKSD